MNKINFWAQKSSKATANKKVKNIVKTLAKCILPREFIIWQGPVVTKNVALTFDDGPNPNYTERVLDLLSRHKIKASFFVLGKNLERYPDIGKKIVGDGHLLGNHTYSHKKSCEISVKEFDEELNRTKGLIRKISGRDFNYFRYPFGVISFLTLWYCISKHFTTVQWSLDSRDFEHISTKHILANVIDNEAEGGDIILLHDDNEFTLEALPVIVEHFQNKGFKFVTVEEMLK